MVGITDVVTVLSRYGMAESFDEVWTCNCAFATDIEKLEEVVDGLVGHNDV